MKVEMLKEEKRKKKRKKWHQWQSLKGPTVTNINEMYDDYITCYVCKTDFFENIGIYRFTWMQYNWTIRQFLANLGTFNEWKTKIWQKLSKITNSMKCNREISANSTIPIFNFNWNIFNLIPYWKGSQLRLKTLIHLNTKGSVFNIQCTMFIENESKHRRATCYNSEYI